MERGVWSPGRSRLRGAIAVGAFYAILGSVLGAIVLVILGAALDWATTTLDPPFAFIVIAFVSGVIPLFVAGFAVGWTTPVGLWSTALASVVVALVVGGLWGLAASRSHDESVIVSVAEVGLGCAAAALFCAIVLVALRRRARSRRGGLAA